MTGLSHIVCIIVAQSPTDIPTSTRDRYMQPNALVCGARWPVQPHQNFHFNAVGDLCGPKINLGEERLAATCQEG